jgi:hypothetical protein
LHEKVHKKVKQGKIRCDSSDKIFKFKIIALGIEAFMSMEQIKSSIIVETIEDLALLLVHHENEKLESKSKIYFKR